MTTLAQTFSRLFRRRPPESAPASAPLVRRPQEDGHAVEIAPDDPLIAYFSGSTGGGRGGPAPAGLAGAGRAPRRGREAHRAARQPGRADRAAQPWLAVVRARVLAGRPQAARRAHGARRAGGAVAQLVRQQEAEARNRARIEQELRVAQLIQQQFLPKSLPTLPGWRMAAYCRPAREVGGDFYDLIELPDGLVGVVVGDVTDKGVPAALVMATTHSILRGEAPRLVSPGEVLARANEQLVAEMPPSMFVTCLYAVLDPATGLLRYANAAHNLPYVRTAAGGVVELRATGMPLGLLSGMDYEEMQAVLGPGDGMLLHSDGLAEAHNPGREMFGFPRLAKLVGASPGGQPLIDALLEELDRFTAPD